MLVVVRLASEKNIPALSSYSVAIGGGFTAVIVLPSVVRASWLTSDAVKVLTISMLQWTKAVAFFQVICKLLQKSTGNSLVKQNGVLKLKHFC